jgi:hypothetical protein
LQRGERARIRPSEKSMLSRIVPGRRMISRVN